MVEPLSSWRDGGARDAILRFVNRVADDGSRETVPVDDRVAVFDNDGTLWCEKPMPIQLDFILRRLAAMAEADEALRDRQPWKSAYERDYGWLAAAVAEHYAGEDTRAGILADGVVAGFGNISVEQFAAQSEGFLRGVRHPTLDRGYLECAYAPMIELLGYLEQQGFSNYIASGGGRDFMRPISAEVYGIPSERVIGSSVGLVYTPDDRGGTITRQAASDYLDDGRRSRCGSGAVPDAGHYWPLRTPTGTSKCSTTHNTPTSPPCASSSSTTTLTVSSTTSRALSRPWTGQPPAGGPS
jgi:phosphoglycolate phosphatase-like HAD superfamily hydrolase